MRTSLWLIIVFRMSFSKALVHFPQINHSMMVWRNLLEVLRIVSFVRMMGVVTNSIIISVITIVLLVMMIVVK